MIELVKKGKYVLGETKKHTKILNLDKACYLWLDLPAIGDVLSYSSKPQDIETRLSKGEYRIYDIKDEPELVDLKHLELEIGPKTWQGFLLLTGLPTEKKKRSRIISTQENVYLHKQADKEPILLTCNLIRGLP